MWGIDVHSFFQAKMVFVRLKEGLSVLNKKDASTAQKLIQQMRGTSTAELPAVELHMFPEDPSNVVPQPKFTVSYPWCMGCHMVWSNTWCTVPVRPGCLAWQKQPSFFVFLEWESESLECRCMRGFGMDGVADSKSSRTFSAACVPMSTC